MESIEAANMVREDRYNREADGTWHDSDYADFDETMADHGEWAMDILPMIIDALKSVDDALPSGATNPFDESI